MNYAFCSAAQKQQSFGFKINFWAVDWKLWLVFGLCEGVGGSKFFH